MSISSQFILFLTVVIYCTEYIFPYCFHDEIILKKKCYIQRIQKIILSYFILLMAISEKRNFSFKILIIYNATFS